ncbi:hypothetical protein FRB90_006863, partial [Tulasnella sp. 427]
MKSAILSTLSLVSLVAASAVEVIPMYTTSYPGAQPTTTPAAAAYQAAYKAGTTTTTPAPAATQT